jgi:hypothetical protein
VGFSNPFIMAPRRNRDAVAQYGREQQIDGAWLQVLGVSGATEPASQELFRGLADRAAVINIKTMLTANNKTHKTERTELDAQ